VELRALLTATLRKAGFEVLEAADGSALLDQVGDVLLHDRDLSTLDVIVSDIRMPGWSGLDVVAGLVHSDCRVPVVLITAYADAGTCEAAARLGVKAVLQKPVDMDDVCTAVIQALMSTRTGPVAPQAPQDPAQHQAS
jgi:CheY-like chemotaxis protein